MGFLGSIFGLHAKSELEADIDAAFGAVRKSDLPALDALAEKYGQALFNVKKKDKNILQFCATRDNDVVLSHLIDIQERFIADTLARNSGKKIIPGRDNNLQFFLRDAFTICRSQDKLKCLEVILQRGVKSEPSIRIFGKPTTRKAANMIATADKIRADYLKRKADEAQAQGQSAPTADTSTVLKKDTITKKVQFK